jgi:hypothetical protein
MSNTRGTSSFLLAAMALGALILVADSSSAQAPPPQTVATPAAATQAAAPTPDEAAPSSYGALDASGSGFLIGRTKYGEMRIGG